MHVLIGALGILLGCGIIVGSFVVADVAYDRGVVGATGSAVLKLVLPGLLGVLVCVLVVAVAS
jgi:hypothetical protein